MRGRGEGSLNSRTSVAVLDPYAPGAGAGRTETRVLMDDTNLDGRPDKLETHQRGRLMYVDPDLAEAGRPTRRVVYGTGGNVERMERDADGDGQFLPDPPAGGVR